MAVTIVSANNNGFNIVKGPSGRLWTTVGTTTVTFYYSDDQGATWSAATGTVSVSSQGWLSIDSDGYLHFNYSSSSNVGAYRRGTYDDAGTITWSSAMTTDQSGKPPRSRVVAFPDPDSTGWKAFWMYQNGFSGSTNGFHELTISDIGGFTHSSTAMSASNFISFTDLDFKHTGDGLTVDSDNPHLYLSYEKNNDSFFRKISYSAGTWSIGTERTISTTHDRTHGLFDGTRYIMCADAGSTPQVWERNEADTSTTLLTSPSTTTTGNSKLTYDSSGNIYILWQHSSGSDMYYNKYDRGNTSWGAATQIDTADGTNSRWGWDEGRLGGFRGAHWQDLAPATDVNYWETVLTFVDTPTWDSPEEGSEHKREQELVLDWNFQDPDVGASQTAYRIKRIVDAATTTYWNGTDWQASADGSTKISSAASQHTLTQNWADKTDTSHEYFVMTWDDGDSQSDFSLGLTIYPTSIESVNRGLSLPRPYKKQDNLVGTLKSNNDYMLGWVNSYVPSYGDANDDLTLRAGLRAASQSLMRDVFPPVIGEYSVGNDTSYFNNLGATNVYRTNELALSSKRFKDFKDKKLIPNAIEFIRKLPLSTYSYKDKKKNGDAKHRIGLTAEDLVEAILESGDTPKDSSLVMHTWAEDGEIVWHINEAQLIPILWQAIQELSEEVFKLKDKNT